MDDFDKWWHDVVSEEQRYAGKRKDLARDAWEAGRDLPPSDSDYGAATSLDRIASLLGIPQWENHTDVVDAVQSLLKVSDQ